MTDVWHRRHRDQVRTNDPVRDDAVAKDVWIEGHLTATAPTPAVIKAPRAGDLVHIDTAA